MTYSSVIVPKVAEGEVFHQSNLGVDTYDLNDLYSPDTATWKSKVLDLGSPKYEPNKTYIFDRSRYRNHGTITGAQWKRLPSGLWYLDFNGSSDVVQKATHLITPIQAFSFACWARNDSGSGSLYAEGRTADIFPFFRIRFTTTIIAISARNDANAEVAVSSSNGASAGVWHFIGVNCDGAGTYRFHIDNNHYAETADTMAGAFTLLAKFAIGATDRDALGDYFDGGIALHRIVTASWADTTFDSYYQRERSFFGR